MKLDVIVKDFGSLSVAQLNFVTLLAKKLAGLLYNTHGKEVGSVLLEVQRGGERSPFLKGMGYPIQLNAHANDHDGNSLFVRTVWVFANTIDGAYCFYYEDHNVSSDPDAVMQEVVDHLVDSIKE